MKTTYSVFLAVLGGASLLGLMPYQARTDEARARIEQNQGTVREERAVRAAAAPKSGNLLLDHSTQPPPAVSERMELKNTALVTRVGQPPAEISPRLQVSADPRDQVQLSVLDGIVTIHGSVGSEEVARNLVKQFAQIPGVRQVRNQLSVRTHPDLRIAVELREAFSRDPITDTGAIAVTVYRGMVFLSGAVASQEESARAEELARNIQGVTRVSNGLRLPTTRTPIRQTTRLPSRAKGAIRTR